MTQAFFPRQADGSLVFKKGSCVGSLLIGQKFTGARYFHGRPSAVDYNAACSGGFNLAPSSRALAGAVEERYRSLAADQPELARERTPLDLVTGSASGLDPHLSPAAALCQVPRVARARGVSEEKVRLLVRQHVQRPVGGILGEPCVNVLELNLALDAAFGP